MKIQGLIAGALCAVAMSAVAAPSQAKTVDLTYTSTSGPSQTFTAALTVSNAINSLGGYNITGITGTAFGDPVTGTDTITGLDPNSSPPTTEGDALSGGGFGFNNVFYTGATSFDGQGLMFVGQSGLEYNLFSTGSPGQYAFYEAVGSPTIYGPNSTGTLSISAVPEPAAWSMMLMGLGGLGAMMRMGRKQRVAFA